MLFDWACDIVDLEIQFEGVFVKSAHSFFVLDHHSVDKHEPWRASIDTRLLFGYRLLFAGIFFVLIVLLPSSALDDVAGCSS